MGEVKHECEHGQLARVCNICGYESDIADLTAERNALRAEVAKLSAAAAQMREALEAFDADQVPHDMALEMREAALAADAGRNYVDASGAVEATVCRYPSSSGAPWPVHLSPDLPDSFVGSKVVVAKVKP